MIWKMKKRYRKHLIAFFVERFPPLDLNWHDDTQAAWRRCWEKLLRLTSKVDKPQRARDSRAASREADVRDGENH